MLLLVQEIKHLPIELLVNRYATVNLSVAWIASDCFFCKVCSCERMNSIELDTNKKNYLGIFVVELCC